MRDTFGRTIRMQGTLVDITERIEIEARLHQEQEFVRRLVASFPDVIAVMDLDGRLTFISPRIQEVLGHPAPDLIGKVLWAQVHRDDAAELTSAFRKLANGELAHAQLEYRTKHADGTWRMLRASASPLFDASGKINGVVASARDVTETRAAEKQQLQKEKLAAMGEMMAGVAHELNNPLTAILGISDLMRERAADDATRRQVEIVLKQARRAAGIVQNLLAFSRPSALASKTLRPEQVIKQVIDQQQASLRQKNVAIQLEAPEGLPAVDADPRLLQQVFVNLIVNAEQAISSRRDHGTLRIAVEAARWENRIRICGRRPGNFAGKSRQDLRSFFHYETARRRHWPGIDDLSGHREGTWRDDGSAIDARGRRGISRDSAGGEGRQPRRRRWHPKAQAQPRRAQPSALQGRSVYVVDDEESIREIVQEGLSARGMKVEGASSSEEALPHLATHTYDFVLCDFNLPGLNGEQFFERMQANGPAVQRRNLCSCPARCWIPAPWQRFSEKGAAVLQKPFHMAGLAALLTELLEPPPSKAT